MHIAVITRNMCAGGAERVIAQLLESWSAMGVRCSLVCMYPETAFYAVPKTVDLCEVPQLDEDPNADKLKKYAYLRKYLKKLAPDVVLAMPEDIGIYVILAMLGTRIPVAVSERNNPWVMPNKKITRLLRRIAYPFAKGLIFQTEQAASFFSKQQRRKGIVLPNPLDLSRLPEVYRGEREKVVVGAGRLSEQKNFPMLIEAFSLFRKAHPEYTLCIYGEGEKREELEHLAEKLLPEDSWSMPGRVEDLPQRISRCAMFALSSDYEGMPNVLIEAMAVGTPVVSADCAPGGAASLIENNKNGILVPVKDVQSLAKGLCYMAENPDSAANMAKKATGIRQKLDTQKVSAQWLRYLAKCAEK